MQQLNETRYGDHLRGCADLAIEIAKRMNIHDDSARQACFATVIINAERHNVFMEPTPRDTKTPVIQPETAAVEPSVTTKGVETAAAEKDQQAAEKADEQINDVPRTITSDQSEGQRRTSFLAGIQSARELLNKLGHQPPITPKGLNAYIGKQFAPKTELGQLDVDELEKLTMLLSSKVDVQREKNTKINSDDLEI